MSTANIYNLCNCLHNLFLERKFQNVFFLLAVNYFFVIKILNSFNKNSNICFNYSTKTIIISHSSFLYFFHNKAGVKKSIFHCAYAFFLYVGGNQQQQQPQQQQQKTTTTSSSKKKYKKKKKNHKKTTAAYKETECKKSRDRKRKTKENQKASNQKVVVAYICSSCC